MLDRLQASDFLPCLNEEFAVRLDGMEPIVLELISVTETSSAPGPGARRPFSLQFRGPVSSRYLVQHIYPLRHEKMGSLEIFLVPLGPEEGRMQYEAIFT